MSEQRTRQSLEPAGPGGSAPEREPGAAADAPWQRPRLTLKRRLAGWPASLGINGVLVYLTLVPLTVLIVSSLRPSGFALEDGWTLSHYISVYTSMSTYRMLGATLVLGLGSTFVAITLGTLFAWLVERTDLPGRRLFRVLIILPMATPPLLLGISWVLLLSPSIGVINTALEALLGTDAFTINIYTMAGMIFVQGLAFTSTAFLLLAPAFRNMDPSLEEAALASGAPMGMTIRKILLPLMRPGLLAATVFIFIASLLVFDIPGLLGVRGGIFVLSSEIYYQLAGQAGLPNYGAVSAIAVLPLLALVPLTFVYQRLIRTGDRFVTVTGKGYRPRPISLGRWRYLATAGVSAYFAAGVIVPLLVLFATSLLPYYTGLRLDLIGTMTLDNHRTLWGDQNVLGAARNTMVVGLVVATSLAVAAPLVSWVVIKSKVVGRGLIDRLAFLPVALSQIMIGLALIYVYLAFRIIPIYGTIWIIAIAHVTAYLTFATRTLNGAMLQLHPELEESARTSGATWTRSFRRISVPLLSPAILIVWIWVLSHSMRELSAALMLQGTGNQMISTVLWSYWHGGRATVATAVGVWLMLALALLAVLWDRLGGRSTLGR